MIGVWPTKSKKDNYFLALVRYFLFVLFCFVLLFFWSSSPSFHFSQDFLNLLGFRLNAKTFLYCSAKQFFFRASSILLTLLSISECKKLIFHAKRLRGCIRYTTPRTVTTSNMCSSAHFPLSWWEPKMKDKSIEKKDLQMILNLSNNWTKPWRNLFHLFFHTKAVWLYFINF